MEVKEVSVCHKPRQDAPIPPGFKQTEAGVLPEEWEVKPLADLFTFSGGLSASRAQLGNDGYCYLHYGDIHTSSKSYIDVDTQCVDLPKLDVPLSEVNRKSILLDGDIVFVDASEDDEGASKHQVINNPNNIPFIAGLHTIVAKSKSDELVNNYKRYCFQTRSIKKQFLFYAVGTKVTGISKSNIGKIYLPIPTRAEQEAISKALVDADALIESLEQLIVKKRLIKKGAMQELLTGKKRLPGFSGKWSVRLLVEVIESCSSGATPYRGRPEYFKGNVKWITSSELNYNVISDTIEHISEDAVRDAHLTVHPSGTFLMAITGLEAAGTRGACGIIGSPATTNQSCMAIYPSPELKTQYLYHFYVFRGNELALRYCQGTKQQSYTAKLVRLIPIDLPPTVEEQTAIATVLTNMDAEITALEEKLVKIRQIKQGMMQELLTGRIRLV